MLQLKLLLVVVQKYTGKETVEAKNINAQMNGKSNAQYNKHVGDIACDSLMPIENDGLGLWNEKARWCRRKGWSKFDWTLSNLPAGPA